MKKIVTRLLVVCFICSNCFSFGSSVVVQMSQLGVEGEKIKDTTLLIEDGILDVLFESGYIVTNLPISINVDYSTQSKKMIENAKSAYMNTIVYVGLSYHNFGNAEDKTIVVSDIDFVDVKIVNAKTSAILFEGFIDGEQKGQYETDITAVKHFANSIGLDIKRQLEKI